MHKFRKNGIQQIWALQKRLYQSRNVYMRISLNFTEQTGRVLHVAKPEPTK